MRGPGYAHSTRDKLSSTRSRAIGAKSPRSTSGSSSCLGWWKLLNIGAIGLRLVGSEKVGAYPSTCQAPRAYYRIAPPISKRVAETKSLPRLKGLSTAALRHGHRCENQNWRIFQLDILIRRRRGMVSPLISGGPILSICLIGRNRSVSFSAFTSAAYLYRQHWP